MSLEQGTKPKNGKIIISHSKENTSAYSVMAESNTADSDSDENSYISSQLSEIEENYERKINDLQNEFSQLKDFMMAIINKPDQ